MDLLNSFRNSGEKAMSKNRSDRVAADFQHDSHSKLTEMQRQVYSDSFLFSIDYIVEQFQKNHFYIPESKRHLIWSKRQQMKLIETLLLGLPVPFMFVRNVHEINSPTRPDRFWKPVRSDSTLWNLFHTGSLGMIMK
jgi:hypothetical protein